MGIFYWARFYEKGNSSMACTDNLNPSRFDQRNPTNDLSLNDQVSLTILGDDSANVPVQ